MEERLWILKRCPLFETLDAVQLGLLERRAKMRTFAKKNLVYLPSDSADGVFLLAEGRVQLSSYTADGKQTVLGFIEPGELFGELALIHTGVREEHAEAVAKSLVIWIPADDMQQVMEHSAALAFGLTRLIGFRRRRIERRLKSLMFRSTRDRILHLLCELAEQYGRREPLGVLIALPLTHQDLANLIGSTRETVTTLLGELQLEGLIEVGRKRFLIKNPLRLARLAEAVGHDCAPLPDAPPGWERTVSPVPVR
jgi:CRP/FNR family cyclic AMP-dependent transcriptional regulator